MILGCHCGMSGTEMMLGSVKEALGYNANALMIYTGAPQNTVRKALKELHIAEALKLMDEYKIDRKHLIIHAPYIINPATTDPDKRDFCINFLTQEVKRSFAMGSKVIVLHPGNTLGLPIDDAINNICSAVNQIIENTLETDVVIAFETMAGKGTEVGRTFEEIRKLLDGIKHQERVGVCVDTCHMFDSGYDIVNDYENVKKRLDEIIGIERIKVIHLNDSKNPLASHKDRHANIGEGYIGFDALKRVCDDETFVNIPKILETPYIDGVAPYKEEIARLRGE
jgi:deoxyribonuclease-4